MSEKRYNLVVHFAYFYKKGVAIHFKKNAFIASDQEVVGAKKKIVSSIQFQVCLPCGNNLQLSVNHCLASVLALPSS